jgi:hypothetical protein
MQDNQEVSSGAVATVQVPETPQFSTAEYAHIPGTERCRICSNLISGQYFRVNGQMACATCAQQAQNGQPADSHAAFLRGLLLGIGGAVVGLILYSTVAIVTGWTIGYVALAAGWLVGKGISKGSNGMGGRRYQIAAVALTYLAISFSAIPIGISYAIKNAPVKAHHATPADGSTTADSRAQDSDASKPAASGGDVHLGALLGQLALMGVASPFLELQDPVHGAIGLVILFVGVSIAYRLTASKPLAVDGPYSVTG